MTVARGIISDEDATKLFLSGFHAISNRRPKWGGVVAKRKAATKANTSGALAKFPRHNVAKSLRIPAAIIEQNAGKPCTDRESARFAGVGYNGPYKVEVSSALKYGFLERPQAGSIAVTDRARKALRPQRPGEEIEAYREAILDAPDFSDVYSHYRGENLPDRSFFDHALIDRFHIPSDKVSEFHDLFMSSLEAARLVEKSGDKIRVLDISGPGTPSLKGTEKLKSKPSQADSSDDVCFVMMPFAAPIGNYYQLLFDPAIRKVGLTPVRADNDIFGTGKIMDQIWRGITNAKVLVAVLTGRNPNVLYELGLAHALDKPVVLISASEDDVPFDLHHIRVIYYDVSDPFWGEKLIAKVSENIASALENPEEAVFKTVLASPT